MHYHKFLLYYFLAAHFVVKWAKNIPVCQLNGSMSAPFAKSALSMKNALPIIKQLEDAPNIIYAHYAAEHMK
jgi:hypothetical protein